MLLLLWDASALVKRYALERGSEATDALFLEVPLAQMVTTFMGYAETYSVLLRKRNRRDLTEPTFRSAVSLLQAEVLDSHDFALLTVSDLAFLDGIELMENYSLNSSDAAILTAFRSYAEGEAAIGSRCVLIAADQRFVHAAQTGS
jgi:predicted nucleic acid-binding protein